MRWNGWKARASGAGVDATITEHLDESFRVLSGELSEPLEALVVCVVVHHDPGDQRVVGRGSPHRQRRSLSDIGRRRRRLPRAWFAS